MLDPNADGDIGHTRPRVSGGERDDMGRDTGRTGGAAGGERGVSSGERGGRVGERGGVRWNVGRAAGRAVLLVLGLIVVIAVAGGVGGYHWLKQQFYAPGPASVPVRTQVDQGATIRAVLTHLAAQGAVRNARAVEWYLRIKGQHPRIQVGAYEIPAGASPAHIIELFEQGRVILEQITVVEGSTFADFRRELDNHAAVSHTLRGKSNAEVMAALGHAGENPEGRFFPDTYRFAAKTTDLEILTLAYNSMQKLLETAWRERSPDLPYDTPYAALTLASIVEKETGVPAERPRIAGVFVNRLRKGMRLQSDPTVIYGVGEKYDGNIHTHDLLTDTPYNTYTRGGLPPTPIALPGRESVLAAVHPLDTGELYFVATGTGDGGHHFSKTLEEHNAAVKAYLARYRAQYGPAQYAPDQRAPDQHAGSPSHAGPTHPPATSGTR